MSKLAASAAAEEYARVRESPFPRVHGRPAWKDYLKFKKHAVGARHMVMSILLRADPWVLAGY